MAKLSQTEKYTIQGALHSGKTSTEIAKMLNRTEKCITNYTEGELDKLHSTIAKVQADKILEEPVAADNPPELVKPDLTKIKRLPRGQGKFAMARSTAGGKGGVAVMTPGASAVGDDFRKEMGQHTSRSARGNLYDAEGNLKE
jgi:hypothetical protein